eukprot:gene5093-10190_t
MRCLRERCSYPSAVMLVCIFCILPCILSGNGDPFGEIASHLVRTASKEFKGFSEKDIKNSISKLALGQSTLKSMDGVSHHFSNTFKDTSSLTARYQKFIDGDHRSAKEAGKVLEYVITVETSLQALEVLQAVCEKNSRRRKQYFEEAGLEHMAHSEVTANKMKCAVDIFRPMVLKGTAAASRHKKNTPPRRFHPEELVVVITDASPLSRLLQVLEQKPKVMPLLSTGVVEEEVAVQPTLFALAANCLHDVLGDHILPLIPTPGPIPVSSDTTTPSTFLSDPVKGNGNGQKNELQSATKVRQRRAFDSSQKDSGIINGNMDNCNVSASLSLPPLSATGKPLPTRIRVIGHSGGAGVAALVAAVLDGSLNVSSSTSSSSTSKSSKTDSLHQLVRPFTGLYNKGFVKAMCIGSPPCLSRAVIPRHVTSLICGDDLVPRASRDALKHMRSRILRTAVARRSLSPLGWLPIGDWMNDAAAVTGQGLRQYAAGGHDLESLSVPGRVFFVKRRKLKDVSPDPDLNLNPDSEAQAESQTQTIPHFLRSFDIFDGASLQRVMRGNWKEDLLWTLHEIMLSSRMVEHHSLAAYIRALARC